MSYSIPYLNVALNCFFINAPLNLMAITFGLVGLISGAQNVCRRLVRTLTFDSFNSGVMTQDDTTSCTIVAYY